MTKAEDKLEREAAAEERARKSWRELLTDFTQRTTYHGLSYITEITPYFTRRIVWSLVVSIMTGLFIYITGETILRFFKYDKTVNVEIVNQDNMLFPAVTICNQNYLRTSVTYEEGLYDDVASFFTRQFLFEDSDESDCDQKEAFVLVENVHFSNITGATSLFQFDDTTAEVCRHLCSKWLDGDEYATPGNYCAGIFFDTDQMECVVIMGSDDYYSVTVTLVKEPGVMFYRRMLCDSSRVKVISTTEEHVRNGTSGSAGMQYWSGRVEEFMSLAAHNGSVMIQSCFYEGRPCRPEDFHLSMTDYGQCYTFNSRERNQEPHQTNQTGSTRGLQLVINVEEYEYMPGPNQDAGIKVILHPPDELPMVRDLGFAVPPGRHSLIGVKATEIVNLPKPHGNCGKLDLEGYKTYTYHRCRMECETKTAKEVCGCRAVYMRSPKSDETGEPAVCEFSNYFHCLKMLETGEANMTAVQCVKCIEPCQRIIYEPVVSNAALSSLSIDKILAATSDYAMKQRRKALSIQQRIDSSRFRALATGLYRVQSYYKSFLNQTRYTTEQMYFALINPCVKSLKEMIAVFKNDLSDTILANFHPVNERLGVVFGPVKETSNYVTGRVIRNVQLVALHLRNLVTQGFKYFDLERLMADSIEFTTGIHIIIPSYQQMVKNVTASLIELNFKPETTPFLPSQLSVDSSECNEHFHDFYLYTNLTKEHLLKFADLVIRFTNASAGDEKDDISTAIQQNLKPFVKDLNGFEIEYKFVKEYCLDAYDLVMDSIKKLNASYPKQVVINTDLDYTFDYYMEAEFVMQDAERFDRFIYEYLTTASVAKDEFTTKNITDDLMNDSIQRARSLISKIKFRVTERLRRRMDKARADVIDWYESAITDGQNLTKFMPANFMEKRLRDMEIWHEPVAVPRNRHPCECAMLMRYANSTANWTLPNFLSMETQAVARQIINRFFDPINERLNQYDQSLDEFEISLSNQIKRMRSMIGELRDQDKEGTTFVLKNFLQMDVYFSELRMQRIVQIPKMEIEDLAGNIGGYMGLLLGASVITIFEVLDLIIYNLIIKIKYKIKDVKNKITVKPHKAIYDGKSDVTITDDTKNDKHNSSCTNEIEKKTY